TFAYFVRGRLLKRNALGRMWWMARVESNLLNLPRESSPRDAK
ncbi:MAG: hypothetical protein ACI9G6_002553, partial [Limisphaerales bacterium]